MNVAYVIVVFCATVVSGQLSVGDPCQLAQTGAAGVCKLINDCNEAIVNLLQHQQQPMVCGYKNRVQIVCCSAPIVVTTTTTPAPTRISQRKCRQYQDAIYERTWTSVGFNQQPVLQKILHCAVSTVPLVVGGEVANPAEFPHMALIGYERDSEPGVVLWNCGGSLISENFVLTAAHCVDIARIQGKAKYVLLGEHDLTNNNRDRPFQVEIAQGIPHPQFKRTSKYYDIALIRMAIRITFNQYMRPLCLPETYTPHFGKAIATGWGRTEFRGNTSNVLMKVILELFSEDECNATYLDVSRTSQLRYGIQPSQQFCAGSHFEKKDTCQGDSGGPIQQNHPYINCMYTIYGITSFAKQCGDLNAPGVYTRVYDFLDWIENIVWPNQ